MWHPRRFSAMLLSLKLILVRSRPATGRGAHRKRTSVTLAFGRGAVETDFRHAGPVSTGPYGMNAAFTRLESL